MIETFVRRPATTVMFILVFVILGIIGYFNLPIESKPKVDFPFVTIRTLYPGATPIEIETQIVKKIEDAVSEISGIKNLSGWVYEGHAFTFIEFVLGSDINVKSIEVKDKVEKILNTLPNNAEDPIIEKFDPMAEPIIDVVLYSDTVDSLKLFELADKKLKNKFSIIEGVAQVDLKGGKKRQINVKLDPTLMKKNYVSITDIIRSVALKNINIPSGSIDQKKYSTNIRFIGEFQSVNELKNMTITSGDGTKLKLQDLAIVEDGFKKIDKMALFNSKQAVAMSINKVSDANTIKVAENIKKALPEIQELLPDGVKLEIATDASTFVINETDSTQINILIGILLTIIVLFLFTGMLRVTFIAAIVIPSSIVSAFLLMDFSKFTINMMTLLAMATALGTLIANAIVIIENVLVHLEHHEDSYDAAIAGTKEVSIAVLASTGTNLVVFTPIAFMGGIAGQFLKEFGLTVCFATIFSLIASFSLTPMLCGVFLKKKNNNGNNNKRGNILVRFSNKIIDFLLKEYKVLFDFTFRWPKTTIVTLIAIFALSVPLLKFVGNEFLSKYDMDIITIKSVLPQGQTINSSYEVVTDIENIVKKIPEVKSYFSSIGDNGEENATITVNLVTQDKRTKSDLDIINQILPELAKIPDAEISIARGKQVSGMSGDLSINLYGNDYDEMIKNSKLMSQIILETGYFRDLTVSYKKPKKEVLFIPDQDKLSNYGISNTMIAKSLRASIYGDDSNLYKEKGEEYKINISLDDPYKTQTKQIKNINVISKDGLLPITAFGRVEEKNSIPPIKRRNKSRIINIVGNLSKSTFGYVKTILDKEFKEKIKFNGQSGYMYTGQAETQKESFTEIAKAFLLAIILTYMLLTAILNSFIYPFVIATSILTSLSGVVLFLFYSGLSINIGTMLATVMLVGLVVNSAILLLDYTLLKLKEGIPIIDSLWLGAKFKFKAIIMTSIAIVFGALPQLWSVNTVKSSIAAVIIGGILASIVFTLFLIPVLFWYAERIRRFFGFR